MRGEVISVLLVVVLLVGAGAGYFIGVANQRTVTSASTTTATSTSTTTVTKTVNSTSPFLVPLYLAAYGPDSYCAGPSSYELCGTFYYSGAMVFNCWANLSQPSGCTYNFGTYPEAFNITIRFLPGGLNTSTGYNCKAAYAEPPNELGPQPPPIPTYFPALCFQTNSTAFVIMGSEYVYPPNGPV